MAAETTKEGVNYLFGGDYYCRGDKGLTTKTYELNVIFPELLKSPLASFKKGVSTTGHPIRALMLNKYPDFTSIRTFNVLGVANYTNSKPVKTNDINLMDIKQLENYIIENGYNINIKVYDNQVDKIRGAITLLQTDPDKFEEVYNETVREYEYNKRLQELNSLNNADGNSTAEDNGDINDLLGELDQGTAEGESDTHE